MHEMAITQNMLDMALRHAGDRKITAIHLRVGEAAPIVAESVDLFFEHLSKGTRAQGARLHFEVAPIRLVCQECGAESDLSAWRGQRPQIMLARGLAAGCRCGSRDLKPAEGLGFEMVSLEVDDDPGGGPAHLGESGGM
jgi:hydrogenase nickel incorporation protein HypA/HybF